jgi:cell division protease FtsH
VAGEAGVPFISVSASEFIELYVGMGAARVRDVFARAREQAPSIVFIDEIDAVAKGRSEGRMRGMGNDEREQTLNQLLTELDGFDGDSLVICIAATNRADTLDSALKRPGRFDRTVTVERPDKQGRKEILGVHIGSRNLPLKEGFVVDDIATMTAGFTGADLANLVNEAALLAGRKGLTTVGEKEFEDAVLRTVAGIEKKRSLLTPAEKVSISQSPRSACAIAHTRTRRDYYGQKGAFPRTVTLTVYVIPIPHTHGRPTDPFFLFIVRLS